MPRVPPAAKLQSVDVRAGILDQITKRQECLLGGGGKQLAASRSRHDRNAGDLMADLRVMPVDPKVQ